MAIPLDVRSFHGELRVDLIRWFRHEVEPSIRVYFADVSGVNLYPVSESEIHVEVYGVPRSKRLSGRRCFAFRMLCEWEVRAGMIVYRRSRSRGS